MYKVTSISDIFEIYGLMATKYAFALEKLTSSVLEKVSTEILRADHIDWDARNNAIMLLNQVNEQQQQLTKASKKQREVEIKIAALESFNQELEKVAYTDDLTQIFNRAGFLKELNQELERFNDPANLGRRADDGAAVVFIDLRKFKSINDTYGHAVGDKALQCVAEILETYTRDEDVVGRWGGDEFVVMIPNISSLDSVSVFERLQKELDDITFDYDDQTIQFSARLGKIHITPNQVADQMMHAADMEMINSKDPRDREGVVQVIDQLNAAPR